MANPQPDKYCKLSNELLDALCRFKIPAEKRRVFDAIMRMTYGYHRKTWIISYSLFELMTGLDRRNIGRAIKWLLESKAIVTEAIATGITYGIQKDYDKWQVLSQKQPHCHSGNRAIVTNDNEPIVIEAPIKDIIKDINKDIKTEKVFSADVIRLTTLLKNLIKENKPDRKFPDGWDEKSKDQIDKMIRTDRRDVNKIQDVIIWCQADIEPRGKSNFCWAPNILSGKKLRKQYDRLDSDSKLFKIGQSNRNTGVSTDHGDDGGLTAF